MKLAAGEMQTEVAVEVVVAKTLASVGAFHSWKLLSYAPLFGL